MLCDRFVDSTFAYQVFETGVPTVLFDAMRDGSLGDLRPNLTFDLDPDVARARLGGRRATAASEDPAEARRDLRRIRRGLLLAAAGSPGRCRVIDADAPSVVVAARIGEVVRSRT